MSTTVPSFRRFGASEQEERLQARSVQGEIKEFTGKYNFSSVRTLEEIRRLCYDGGYTILKDYCSTIRKDRRIQAVYRYETEPGKQSQVDFCEFGYIDMDGKRRKLYAFSIILDIQE
jgi:hypothetical protein